MFSAFGFFRLTPLRFLSRTAREKMYKSLCFIFLFLFLGGPSSCWGSSPDVKATLTTQLEDKLRSKILKLIIESPGGWHLIAPTLDEAQEEYSGEVQFLWEEAQNLDHLEIHWPTPIVEEVSGLKTAYYEGEMVEQENKQNFTFLLTAHLRKEKIPLILKGRLSGVLCRHGQCYPFEVPVILSPEKLPAISRIEVNTTSYTGEALYYSFWVMLGIAFLGGVILNVMPCVLPVLAMKIFSLSKSLEAPNHFRTVCLRTIFGILLSFWVLASIAYFLKEAGETVGWGAHFQEPFFVAFLALTMLLFALNLWGVFHLRTPRFLNTFLNRKEAQSGAFSDVASGFFATLLATPCSAPFLGTAVGIALTQGGMQIFFLFTVLGVGFAFPYLMGAMIPSYLVWLPRPGPWMERVKKVLGVGLFGTALWLGFVFVEEVREEAIQEEFLEGDWLPFSQERLAKFVARGRVVFVDVTARWCMTCHVNHTFVLETQEVNQLLKRYNVVRLRADWTRRNTGITVFLNRFGRAGIPFNVVFGPMVTEGIVLPELLSVKAIEKAIKNSL
jgi:suppressor for copper-sensitivity B